MNRHILSVEHSLSMPLSGMTLIEASAGTGKTYTIGNLYLRLVGEGFRVSQILVVTFTVAATEELRGRIRQRLQQARQQLAGIDSGDDFLRHWAARVEGDALVMARLKLALRSMDEGSIYTIHGFCQRALGEHAFHSCQAFDVDMLSDDSELWQQAIRDWWRSHVYPLDAVSLALFRRVYGSLETLEQQQALLRDRMLRILPEATVSSAACYQRWPQSGEGFVKLAAEWQQRRDELLAILNASPALSRATTAYRQDNLERWQHDWDACFASAEWWLFPESLNPLRRDALEEGSTAKKRGSDPALNDPFFYAVQAWMTGIDELCHDFRVAIVHELHEAATRQVQRVKQQEGLMSFHDQLTRLADALEHNAHLGAALRERFPVAMIDEFQDTDGLQYRIFEHIYRQAHGMLMIGDPKQAIYGFRGGDIFAYIAAAAQTTQQWTLATNWRSTAAMIEAVNSIFSYQANPAFVFDAIPFAPVDAAPHTVAALRREGRTVPAVNIRTVAADAKGKNQSASTAEPLIVNDLANHIATLLNDGAAGTAMLGDRPVRAADIAVLVRTHSEAEAVRAALQQRQVAAVVRATSHVFASEEADGLYVLLQGIATPGDVQRLRLALSSSLLGLDDAAMAERCRDDDAWQSWVEGMQHLHQCWQQQGFMPMFQRLLQELAIGEGLAADALAERRLTNLLHLAELLQQASRTRTISALLHWMVQQRDAKDEAAELRLESDDERVRIVTIHASKGLEYPIVYLPTLWQCRPVGAKTDEAVMFYDEVTAQRCIDLGSDQREQHAATADRERLAEDVRLAYVALTRARSHMVLVWGHVGKNQEQTAMHWLLHGASGRNNDADLAALCNHAAGHIECSPLPMVAEAPVRYQPQRNDTQQAPEARTLHTPLVRDWRMVSFSAMTRDVPHAPFPVMRGEDPVFNFQAGKQTGIFLHALLEQLDFQGDVAHDVQQFCHQQSARYGMAQDCAEVLAPWLQQVVNTPLDASGLRLCDIPRAQRLNELHFDFPLQTLDCAAWQALTEAHAAQPLPRLGTQAYRGYMNGEIDMVFEHRGRYFVVDYKSNLLGSSWPDYAPEALRQAVWQHRYDVQYLIYTLALHRYLRLRLPGYDYDQHCGGVYYLFLRGMRQQHGAAYGVYFDRPPLSLLEALSEVM